MSSTPVPNGPSASGSRSRPQARKKQHDDAPYFAPPVSASSKRQAPDRVDGEPRVKRKRVDTSNTAGGSSAGARKGDKGADTDSKSSLIDFTSLSSAALYRYLTHFDIIPMVYPSPLTAEDPPPPSSLQDPSRHGSRGPSPFTIITPANRPKRDPKEQSRRRSSRLLEDDITSRAPILADVDEVHAVLAGLAERHFRDHIVNEIDTLASFMVKTKCE
ncbi:hypothetical protein SERLA73DRAFT_188687 [Serpula lacrymans var. lacrymans S7.3]|uniref:Histone deacetylase complex subunit SAP30 Sin3 binding domain-containing protein n=2 Tax=Serpula lacrymans var. lacrymans TaxID=341189 RepID=F8QBY4_SERL3|nr:uncharacterized protein SERLADRAFT_479032 [Serpula lacrymans var. lacrymans S7.9]EGN94103.1 hypothetical protein SERLA73DRAFT_188687 [Serpula lacrymans var. lacrymans S7.3]EGO19513.1 hypothetical protein SERLADRAFT_479032 [Serpula lacrymans var. lacrymans S7.9]